MLVGGGGEELYFLNFVCSSLQCGEHLRKQRPLVAAALARNSSLWISTGDYVGRLCPTKNYQFQLFTRLYQATDIWLEPLSNALVSPPSPSLVTLLPRMQSSPSLLKDSARQSVSATLK